MNLLQPIESACFPRWGRIATDKSPTIHSVGFRMPPVGLHRALLFVFSPRGDESTDWQSDGTLHDSTKPWPGRSCSIIHRKGKKERERKEGVWVSA